MILDGCSSRDLERADTPHIDEIAERGASTLECESVCPSATYTAHCSIVTGSYPEVHGIVGNSFYDRERRAVVDLDSEGANHFVLSSTIFERLGVPGIAVGEPIDRGALESVSKGEVQARGLYERDEYAVEKCIELARLYEPGFSIVNLPGVDRVGELYGPSSPELVEHLERIDLLIGELSSALEEIYDDYLLVILADHGMTRVRENVDLGEILEGLDAVVCTSHRSAHVYVGGEDFEEALDRLSGDGRLEVVAAREELARYRLLNPRSGDLFVVAKPGYELGPEELRGSHGGLTPDEMKVPLIVNKREYADLLEGADLTVVAEILARYFREIRALELARERSKSSDPAHGWDHTIRVLALATELAMDTGADVEAVRLACIFHDVERGLDPRGHEVRSARLAERFLRKEKCPRELVEKVKRAILKHHARPGELESLEEKILWDADKLDALGLVGLARCLLEAGFKKEGVREALIHYARDSEEFGRSMHFDETSRMALEKVSKAREFLKALERELKESR